MSPTRNPECRDCRADREQRGAPYPKQPRPAPHPGPRCVTHHRAKVKLAKAGAHARRVQNEYGLEPGQYGELYLSQGRVCAICRRATGKTRRLSVDHDHKTGLVRGLVCRPCNDMLGHLRDDREAALRIAEYLDYPPAARLGIFAIHKSMRKDPTP